MIANYVCVNRCKVSGILPDDDKQIGLDYICIKFRKEQEC